MNREKVTAMSGMESAFSVSYSSGLDPVRLHPQILTARCGVWLFLCAEHERRGGIDRQRWVICIIASAHQNLIVAININDLESRLDREIKKPC
jgi:hypothetical protein